MSVWNLGADDVSQQTQAFKNKLSSKDSECAALQSQLIKRNAEFNELKSTLNETLHKLSREADRALRLEKDFKRCSNDLRNEKLNSQNVQSALSVAHDKIKQEELTARDLQATIDVLSHRSDDSNERTAKLERDKSVADARVKELETNLRQATAAAIAPTSKIPSRHGRPRSSSVNPSLNQEVTDLRATLSKKEADLHSANEKLARVQTELTKVDNEKIALEKKTQIQLRKAQSSLEEKEDELEYLKAQQGDGSMSARAGEEELLQRVEEDEARISALEMMLRDTSEVEGMRDRLKRTEVKLLAEVKKVKTCEARQVELATEKEMALNELENARRESRGLREMVRDQEALVAKARDLESQLATAESRLEVPREPDEAAVAYIARLLSAVDRLRGERDQLRRNVSFLETEAKFTVEALEAQRRGGTGSSAKDQQIKHLSRLATVSAIVINHLQSPADVLASGLLNDDAPSLQAQLQQATKLCAQKDSAITQANNKLTDMEDRFNIKTLDLEAAETQRSHLFSQIKKLEERETERAAEAELAKKSQKEDEVVLQTQLADVTKTLQETEGQRDALTLQLTNLQSDLNDAQRDLTDAQTRYSTLQSHQLASMSSSEASKVLRAQIEELEMRVLRRTEQIGVHQHDIKRLETNLKLSEERVGELMSEVEVLVAEKAAMVEDCADAREARDEAIERVEGLEMEVEVLEGKFGRTEREREVEVGALTGIVIGVIGRSRIAMESAKRNAMDVRQVEDRLGKATDDLKRLADEYQQLVEQLAEKEQGMARSAEEARQATLALAASNVEVHALKDTVTGLQEQQPDADLERLFTNKVAELETKLQDLSRENEEMVADHEQAIAVLVRSREELEERLVESERLQAGSSLSTELESLRAQQADKLGDLQRRLEEISSSLEAEQHLRIEAEAGRKATNVAYEDLVRANKDLESRADEATERSIAAHGMLAEAVSKHESEFSGMQRELDKSVHNTQQLRQKLQEAISTQAREEALRREETVRSERAESMVTDLRQHVANSQKQSDALQTEKTSDEMMVTSLKAEIQRLLSLQRHLECKLEECEGTATSLDRTLEGARSDFIRADNAAKAAQVQLAFEKVEHEQTLMSLRNELAVLKSKPKIEELVAELEERNREMEAMLRSKCAEVEENDDRFIDMLKEKKKLTTKIESLTRKVQTLQAKLAALKGSTPMVAASASEPIRPPSVPPVPPMPPMAIQSGSTPISHTNSAAGPSSLPQPKSPEKRVSLPSVFRPKTPEICRTPDRRACFTSTSETAFPSSSSSAKKRPFDEDHYIKMPPQAFDSSSRPYDGAENSTPRLRKVQQSVHSGFTPVRNNTTARPTLPMPSPHRRADTAPTRKPLSGIADVTNTPRVTVQPNESAKPTKRGWLTKIRGSQAPGRVVSSRHGGHGGIPSHVA